MREELKQCTILYEQWQMQCCGSPLRVGSVAELTANKPYHEDGIFRTDFIEEHHESTVFKLRGLITSIKAIFVDKFADESNRNTDNPNNTFSIYEAEYIDGFNDIANYNGRDPLDVVDYIIVLQDVVVTETRKCKILRNVQEFIKPYFNILPDYGCCLGNFVTDDSSLSYGCDDDTIELEGYDDTPFVVPGIEEWCYQWEVENDKYIKDKLHMLDQAWVERGLALAQAFRQILPDEINLYYGTKRLIEKIKYFVLSPDVHSMIGDTNVQAEAYDENKEEVTIGYFPPIKLTGVDKWWHDFDSHVDYVDSTADENFDWMTWIIQGLDFAKIIRSHLPQSVVVWFRTPFEMRNIIPDLEILINADGSFNIEKFHI